MNTVYDAAAARRRALEAELTAANDAQLATRIEALEARP